MKWSSRNQNDFSDEEIPHSDTYYVAVDPIKRYPKWLTKAKIYRIFGLICSLIWLFLWSAPNLIFGLIFGLIYISNCWKLSIFTMSFGFFTLFESCGHIVAFLYPNMLTINLSRIYVSCFCLVKVGLMIFGIIWNIMSAKQGCENLQYGNWAIIGGGIISILLIILFIVTLKESCFKETDIKKDLKEDLPDSDTEL